LPDKRHAARRVFFMLKDIAKNLTQTKRNCYNRDNNGGIMKNPRITALAVLKILQEYSDRDHLLTNSQIRNLLLECYQLEITDRTLTHLIVALKQLGYDIERYQDNHKGYYLRERDFEDEEIVYLAQSVHSAHFVAQGYSQKLIDKLLRHLSKYQAEAFRQRVYHDNPRKRPNADFFKNIEDILEAIQGKLAICFIYLKYDLEKKLVPRREKPYTLYPLGIVFENNNLYLIGCVPGLDTFSHWRIDKMKDVEITQDTLPKTLQAFDPYDYALSKTYMYSGPDVQVELRFHKRMLDDMIDHFGTQMIVIEDPDDADYCRTTIQSSEQGFVYFALQYLKNCEVLAPASLRQMIQEVLIDGLNQYQKREG
jgi:predicted DNA-binding transcriptional regulator YafY